MHRTRTLSLVALGVALALLGYALPVLGTPPGATVAAEPLPPPSFRPSKQFVHIATTENTAYDTTCFDHPLTNYNANAMVIVTHNYNPSNTGFVNNDHTIGLWFNGTRWCIWNQDDVPMPIGAAFNVLIPSSHSHVLIHVSSAANTTANYTVIDDAALSGRPDLLLFVTPNASPGGGVGGWDDRNIGVWYSGYHERWTIFNQDGAPLAPDVAFNVLVVPPDPAAYVHKATAGTLGYHDTVLDHPLANGRPTALLFTTPHWNPPPGDGGIYNDHTTGVWYDTEGRWRIFNEDQATMPQDAAFNVLVTGNWAYVPLVVKRR
jgi:hypothetical protein